MNTEEAIAQLRALLKWSKPREVPTKRGPRILQDAKPTEEFWSAWRIGREQLSQLGITVGKDRVTGEWEVCWWQAIPRAELEARDKAVEMSRATDADIDVPAPPGLTYMPFQKAGIRFALERTGTLIGDEMGLGKTIQAIGCVNAHPEAENVLVVTKASLKLNWWRELRKWLVSEKLRNSVGVAEGGMFPSSDVVVMNYDIAHRFPNRLNERNWDFVIIDEAHLLKNPATRRAKAICGYKPSRDEPVELASSGVPAKMKLALTGTPIENNIEELWTVLWWIDRAKFPSKSKLLKMAGHRYTPATGHIPPTESGLSRLQRFLRENVMIRRLKRDVLPELPAKTRSVTEFAKDGLEGIVREEVEAWDAGEDARIEAQAAVEVAKASDDPREYERAVAKLRDVVRVAFADMARVRRQTAEAKVPLMIEHLRGRLEEVVGKILVFAHHIEVLERLGREFAGKCVVVHGSHELPHRDKMVHRFMTEDSCRIFFGGIRSTGEGYNLTAATHVIFHEFDWVPSKMVQCEDRAHRIGQKDNVTVEVCVVDGTIDARMAKVCVEKADLAEAVLDAELKKQMLEDPPPVVKDWKPLVTSRKEVEGLALLVNDEQRRAVLLGLGILAGNCDGAHRIDGAGFNKMDAAIGRQLSELPRLSDRQTVLGARLVNRYRKQLPQDLVNAVQGLLGKKGNDHE